MRTLFISTLIVLLGSTTLMAQNSRQSATQKVLAETNRDFLTHFAARTALSMQSELDKVAQEKREMELLSNPANSESQWVSFTATGHPLVIAAANLNAAKTVSTDKVWPGGSMGLNLTGSGLTLAVWDEGKVRTTHQEFGGRVIQKDGTTSLSSHATHVAGTMVAAGVDPLAKGMSYEASLDAYNWVLDVAEMSAAAADGLLISNHSYRFYAGWQGSYWYGDTTVNRYEDLGFGLYHSSARNLDLIANHAPYYLMCFAASNDRLLQPTGGKGYVWNGTAWEWSNTVRPANGPYDCIPYFNTAKNILTVGNVNDITGGYSDPSQVVLWSASSCGPTDDGRIKPDIVANGIGLWSTNSSGDDQYYSSTGTSMSTPNASGSMGLLQQHAFNLWGEYMKAATLKALVIHTTDEAGAADGPDYQFGWGLLNTASAAAVMQQQGATAIISETTLQQGQTFSLPVYSDGTQPLEVTIVWNDPAGPEANWELDPTDLRLINDLDLRVSNGTTWMPYILDPANPSAMATTGDNFRDNVEKILIASPVAGTYDVVVSHKASLTNGEQEFSIVITGVNTTNPGNFTAEATSSQTIDLQWNLNGGSPVMLAFSETNNFGTPANGIPYSEGETLPGGGEVLYTGSGTSFEHTALSATTRYYYRIWSATGVAPDYSTPSFADAQTHCNQPTLPFSETFSNSRLPLCWEMQTDGGVQGFYYSNTDWAGGTQAGEAVAAYEYLLGVNNSTTPPNVTSRLMLPAINTLNINQLVIRFSYTFRDSETWNGAAPVTARLQTSPNGQTWTPSSWSKTSGTGSDFYQQATVVTDQNTGIPTSFISFTLTGDPSDFWYWALDDVKVSDADGFWTGTVSNSWNDAGNWAGGSVPQVTTNVVIPAGTPYSAVVDSDPGAPALCHNMLIERGATLTVAENKALTVSGEIVVEE
jgi:hypothetical protein